MIKPFRRVIKTRPIETASQRHVFDIMRLWYSGWFRAQGKNPNQCADFKLIDTATYPIYRITIIDRDAWNTIAPFFGLSKVENDKPI